MDEALRAALLFFALLSALGALPVVLRRLQPPSLLALHLLGVMSVLGVVLAATAGGEPSAGLLAPYGVAAGLALLYGAGPTGRAPVSRVVLAGAAALAALGAGSAMPRLPGAAILGGVAAMATAAFSAWVAVVLVRRTRDREVPAHRAAERGGAAAAAAVALALALALLPAPLPGVAVVLLGTGGAILTAVRAPPFVPPAAREVLSAGLLALATGFAVFAARAQLIDLAWGFEVGLASLGVLAVSRPLLLASSRARRRTGTLPRERPALERPAIDPRAFEHMGALLDDVTLERPERPRVHARITARRLLDAALERARTSRRGRGRAELEVEVREDSADVDVEGDPSELAFALCAVLDNALGFKERFPELYVRVHVRGSPGHVTFEVSDDLAEHDPEAAGEGPGVNEPFAAGGARTGSARPGLGISLARARAIAERHGGNLLARRTHEGSCVQLTLPRRRQRHPVGRA